jgi:hypothetical protein
MWMKIERRMIGYHEQDLFNGRHVLDGKMFQVKLPSGVVMTLPARVRARTLLQREMPIIKTEEHIYFAVPYEGLREVWLRGIDVEVQEPDAARKTAKRK